MSLLLTCLVKIGNLTYSKVSGVEITSSWKELGDSATLKLYGWVQEVEPDGTMVGPLQKVEDLVKCGDPVEIQLGYDGQLRTEFRGYVAEIKLTVPFEVRCEDEYYHLKRRPVNRSWKKTTLRQLLKDLMPDVVLSPSVPQLTIDGFRADRTTVAGVLAKVKETYLVCAYFREGKLFVGLPYTEFTSTAQGNTSLNGMARTVAGALALYSFQQNVVSDDLSYKRKEDVRLKFKLTAKHRNGKTTSATAGDPDGEERNLTIPSETTDTEQLRKMAESRLGELKYDGYRGKLTSFGVPYVVHSGVADLLDERYPQRAGRYLVDSVRTSFGPEGFRREVELGKRVSV